MTPGPAPWTDEQVEQVVGNLLRAGVLLAAAIILAGAVLYLARHGGGPVDYHEFHAEDPRFCSPIGIVQEALAGSARGIIQLGLLALIATPVARVAFSVYAFGRERDFTYVGITLFVLAVLLFSLSTRTSEGHSRVNVFGSIVCPRSILLARSKRLASHEYPTQLIG